MLIIVLFARPKRTKNDAWGSFPKTPLRSSTIYFILFGFFSHVKREFIFCRTYPFAERSAKIYYSSLSAFFRSFKRLFATLPFGFGGAADREYFITATALPWKCDRRRRECFICLRKASKIMRLPSPCECDCCRSPW